MPATTSLPETFSNIMFPSVLLGEPGADLHATSTTYKPAATKKNTSYQIYNQMPNIHLCWTNQKEESELDR